MYVPIEQIPNTARVWIYQANRNLSASEIEVIKESLTNFCNQWQVHGAPMQTSFSIDHNRFIVLAVNEDANSPSGCSIDSSVHAIKVLEQKLQVDFFSREEIAFLDHASIVTYPLTRLKNLFAEGILGENSITLNTLVQSWGEWKNNRQVKVNETWLKRYIPKVPVS